jgi:hypothetical protein
VTTEATSSNGGEEREMTIKKQQILGVLAAAVATVAFAAPAAHADDWYASAETGVVRPDDRADRTIVLHRNGHAVVIESVRPDDRATRVSPGVVETAVRPDDRAVRVSPVSTAVPVGLPDDRAVVRGPGAAPQTTQAHVVVSPTSFDWADAGIGAGLALGLILLGSGMLLVARRHRRPTAAL